MSDRIRVRRWARFGPEGARTVSDTAPYITVPFAETNAGFTSTTRGDIDLIAVERAVNGCRPKRLTRAEKREAVRILIDRGDLTGTEIARRVGIGMTTMWSWHPELRPQKPSRIKGAAHQAAMAGLTMAVLAAAALSFMPLHYVNPDLDPAAAAAMDRAEQAARDAEAARQAAEAIRQEREGEPA